MLPDNDADLPSRRTRQPEISPRKLVQPFFSTCKSSIGCVYDEYGVRFAFSSAYVEAEPVSLQFYTEG